MKRSSARHKLSARGSDRPARELDDQPVFAIVGIAEASPRARCRRPCSRRSIWSRRSYPTSCAFNTMTGGMAVRTKSDPMNLAPLVQTAVRELYPSAPVHDVMRLGDRLDRTFAEPRFYAIALGLVRRPGALDGDSGCLRGARLRGPDAGGLEFGVRCRALGAGERQIGWLVVGQGAAARGYRPGGGTRHGGERSRRDAIDSCSACSRLDPATFASAAWLVVIVAVAAAWHPSRLALRVDPAEALRME